MENAHVVSRPKAPLLSNGALAFGLTSILCTGKRIKLFAGTELAFNLQFQHLCFKLRKNQVHRSKEPEMLV
jgi:hypothetical protein